MAMFRTSDVKIKDIYDFSANNIVDKFKKRFASTLDKYSKIDTEAARSVVAIQPNYIYYVTSGLHGATLDEPYWNDNGDLFLWSELLRESAEGMPVYSTWVGKPVLANHNPKLVRGMIIDSFPIKSERSVDFLCRIDERIDPNLASGLRNGSITATSMGVMVSRSFCGICKSLARDESEWCVHLSPSKLNIKGRKYLGQDNNAYPDKIGQICWEDNRGLLAVEDSLITLGEPADQAARVRQLIASRSNGIKLSNYQK